MHAPPGSSLPAPADAARSAPFARGLALAGLLVLAGCAGQPRPDQAVAGLQAASAARYGTIVAIRPLSRPTPRAATEASAGDPRGSILDAVGGAVIGGHAETAHRPAMAEFIVRTDDGRPPVSVMQADAAGLRLGQRVLLTGGTRLRIARAGG